MNIDGIVAKHFQVRQVLQAIERLEQQHGNQN